MDYAGTFTHEARKLPSTYSSYRLTPKQLSEINVYTMTSDNGGSLKIGLYAYSSSSLPFKYKFIISYKTEFVNLNTEKFQFI